MNRIEQLLDMKDHWETIGRMRIKEHPDCAEYKRQLVAAVVDEIMYEIYHTDLNGKETC